MADIDSIVDKVLERTEQDRINWLTTVTANTFVASIGNLGVSISIPRSTVIDCIARFRVIDDRGETIQDLSVDNIDTPHMHRKLMEMHSKARQFASRNNPRLDELLAELDKV